MEEWFRIRGYQSQETIPEKVATDFARLGLNKRAADKQRPYCFACWNDLFLHWIIKVDTHEPILIITSERFLFDCPQTTGLRKTTVKKALIVDILLRFSQIFHTIFITSEHTKAQVIQLRAAVEEETKKALCQCEILTYKRVSIPIFQSQLMPSTYKILTEAEIVAEETKRRETRLKFPVLCSSTDAVAEYLGLKIGQVVFVLETNMFRLVVK